MAFVAVAVAGMSAFNQIQQGRTAKMQSDLQAEEDDIQAGQDASAARKTAQLIRRAGRSQVGQANAAYAGAGVKVGEGSAGEVERQIDQNVQHDAYQAILDGDTRALSLRTSGQLARIQGAQAQSAGYVNAATSALGSINSFQTANGWSTAGPGYSGLQKPAPIVTAQPWKP